MRKPTLPVPELTKLAQDRLEKGLTWRGECLIWTGAKTNGYGVIGVCGKVYRVGRVILALTKGDSNLLMTHMCRNRDCVNPEHISYGTATKNVHDRERDGTDNKGSRHGLSKLTEDDVTKIRKMAAYTTGVELSRLFEVSQTTISNILNSNTWKHI